jgi:acetyl-CoA synthetase
MLISSDRKSYYQKMAQHNLQNYSEQREAFEWSRVFADMDWDAPNELNIAHEVCERHASDRGRVALYYVDKNRNSKKLTFWELSRKSNRFANILEGLDVSKGDRVFTHLPNSLEHYVSLIGTLKTGAIFGAINERYGPDGIAHRLNDSDAKVLITAQYNREKVEEALEKIPSLDHVITVNYDDDELWDDDLSYFVAMESACPNYYITKTSGEDEALLYYTSGTTGPAKGVVHNHEWVAGTGIIHKFTFDLQQEDLLWSTNDLGWFMGPTSTLGAWFLGTPIFTFNGKFDPKTYAKLLSNYPITILSSAPTVYRMLQEKDEIFENADLDLRHIISGGEPLNPAIIEWGEQVLGATIHDGYGQTETTYAITNYPAMEQRPGSMGKPLPGTTADIVDSETGHSLEPGEVGEIAHRGNWPSFFDRYWKKPKKTENSFVGDWYLTGDLAYKDEDGYFWFKGRADDVIISSGYRIGPFAVESSIEELESVSESAVIPKPDEKRGNIVKALILPSDSTEMPLEDQEEEIKNHVKNKLAAHEYPREIEFVDEFPRTAVGKIKRNDLREEEAE